MNFCKYSDVFGIPSKGVHSYRLFDVAIVDVVGTIIVAFILQIFFGGAYWKHVLILFMLSIVLHRSFCVRTTVDKLLFPSN